jgi:hypothetical protein
VAFKEETMKRYFILLAMLLSLLTVGHASDPGFSVDSPYLVSIWKCGTELSIIWGKTGDWAQANQVPGNQKVKILLRKVGQARSRHAELIADNIPNVNIQNNYKWKIAGVANGEYHVIVKTVNNQIKGESQVFNIEGCHQMIRKDLKKEMKPLEFAVLATGRIGGRVNGYTDSYNLAGRKIRVLIKKVGALIKSTEYTLDAQGSADYQFTGLQMGTYEISVEKGAPSTTDPAVTLNICFQGTTPAQRPAVISAGSTDITGQDFAVQYAVAFNRQGLCW